jgi:hypothetical protein
MAHVREDASTHHAVVDYLGESQCGNEVAVSQHVVARAVRGPREQLCGRGVRKEPESSFTAGTGKAVAPRTRLPAW